MKTKTIETFQCQSCKKEFNGKTTGPREIHVQCPHCNRISYAPAARVAKVSA